MSIMSPPLFEVAYPMMDNSNQFKSHYNSVQSQIPSNEVLLQKSTKPKKKKKDKRDKLK